MFVLWSCYECSLDAASWRDIHQGKGTSFSLKRRTGEDFEGDKPPLAPDQDLESNLIFQKRGCQLVCVEHRMSILFEGSLMGFFCVKLFKMIQIV